MSDPGRLKVNSSFEGWSFPINPDELVKAVYVAPRCPEASYERIKSESMQMGLKSPVLHSAMDRKPRL